MQTLGDWKKLNQLWGCLVELTNFLSKCDVDFESKANDMASFFVQRDYPNNIVLSALERVRQIPRSVTITPAISLDDLSQRSPFNLWGQYFTFVAVFLLHYFYHFLE